MAEEKRQPKDLLNPDGFADVDWDAIDIREAIKILARHVAEAELKTVEILEEHAGAINDMSGQVIVLAQVANRYLRERKAASDAALDETFAKTFEELEKKGIRQ